MTTLSTEQIIKTFEKANFSISKVQTKGRENGMICVIYRNVPSFFSTYYCAYSFFKSKNLI